MKINIVAPKPNVFKHFFVNVLWPFLKDPVTFIRKKREEKILDEGSDNLDKALNSRFQLRVEIQTWIREKRAIGKIKNNFHATKLVAAKFKDQCEEHKVIPVVVGNNVSFKPIVG